MGAVFRPARHYLLVLACALAALWTAAEAYPLRFPNSDWILRSAFPAFALELAFFLAATMESTRARFAQWANAPIQATALWISGLIPYALFGLLSGNRAPCRADLS